MENIKASSKNLISALNKLSEAIQNLKNFTEKPEMSLPGIMEHQAIVESLRDSLIQRFEFSTDLFWKFLKKYLEVILKKPPEFNGPAPIIRSSCQAKMISEKDSEILLEMIKYRNLTSHVYKEELANEIAAEIPVYYKIMKKCSDQLLMACND